MTLPPDVNWVNVVLALLGIAVLCVVWIVVNYTMKLTIKMFALGCLGILVVGGACAGIAWFSGT